MNMRRLIALFFVFFSAAVASAQIQTPSNSRLQVITKTKLIKIAYRADARPFSFLNDKGEPAGFSIDICKLVVSSLEHQLGLDSIKIEWVPVTLQTRFSAVAIGKADMECGSSTVTLSRMKEIDFSNLVFVESTGVLVAGNSEVHSFADLAGKKIAVVSGTTNEKVVKEHLKLRNLNATLVTVKDRDEAVAALEDGKVDGFASDKLLLAGAQVKHLEALVMLPDDLSIEQYAIVLPRGDWAFRLAVNTGLAQYFRAGKTNELFERWFFGSRPGLLLEALYALGRISE